MKKFNLCILFAALSAALISCNGGSSGSTPASIQYTTMNYHGVLCSGGGSCAGHTGLTGIRAVNDGTDNVYITGSFAALGATINNGTLYVGPVNNNTTGTYYTFNYPSGSGDQSTSATNVYSAESLPNGNVGLTGSYTLAQYAESHNFGFIYTGPATTDGATNSSNWISINMPSIFSPTGGEINNTIPHSIMGDLVVGNYHTAATKGNPFIYDQISNSFVTFTFGSSAASTTARVNPEYAYTTAYGVWHNGGSNYTITGGYGVEANGGCIVTSTYTCKGTHGYVVDYDSVTQQFTNWQSYDYNNTSGIVTHFEGITTDGNGGYNLAGTGLSSTGTIGVAFVHITRTSSSASSSFNPTATWVGLWYPASTTSTADTVYQNYMLGVYETAGSSLLNGFTATIPTSWY